MIASWDVFWSNLPATITAIAAVIAALAGLVASVASVLGYLQSRRNNVQGATLHNDVRHNTAVTVAGNREITEVKKLVNGNVTDLREEVKAVKSELAEHKKACPNGKNGASP